METTPWDELEALFEQALALPAEQRAAFLDEACGHDSDQQAELMSLLDIYVDASSYMEGMQGVVAKAAQGALETSMPSAASEALDTHGLVGTTIAHYKVLEKLGEGGMGIVYRAEDTRLSRIVALKFLPSRLSADEQAKDRFIAEAKAASALDHPNICTIHEIGETERGELYIAMACYAGQTLKEKIAHGPLPLDEALDYAVQIARGLAQAHAAGIVHRDVKPANVMVTEPATAELGGLVKMLDFGLAKMADVQLTKTGTTMGTVAYISPEQARGDIVDHRTDLWSFGVVLYEMLTGQRPFRGDHEQAVLYAVRHEEPLPLTTVNPALPADLWPIVQRCLEKDPAQRYSAMADLVADLEAWTQGETTSSRRKPQTGPRKTSKGHRKWVAGVGVLALLILLLTLPAVRDWLGGVLGRGRLPEQVHLAVLPFSPVGPDSVDQAFIDGLVDVLTGKLVRFEQFQDSFSVEPASQVHEHQVATPGEARQVLGANVAVTGRVAREADQIRITLSLVDTQKRRPLQSLTVTGPMTDLARLHKEVLFAAAALLELELTPAIRRVVLAGDTTKPGAYGLYLRGQVYLRRYEEYEEVDQIDNAIRVFEQALREDSAYALAYAGLGEAYWRKYEKTRDRQWIEQAKTFCNRAVERSDQLAPAYVTLGLIHHGIGEYGSAKGFFELALEYHPFNTDAYRGLAKTYQSLGKHKQAEDTYKQAIALKPEYWGGYYDLGSFYARYNRYEEARELFQQVTALAPDNVIGYRSLGGVYYFLGRFEEAIAAWEWAEEIKPTYEVYSNLATVYYFNFQDYAQAAQMYQRALELRDTNYRLWEYLGAAYYWSGEREKAQGAWRSQISRAQAYLAVNQRDVEVLARLALAYARLDEPEQAHVFIQRVIAETPTEPSPLFLLGIAYELLGNRENAFTWMGKALDNGLSPERIDEDPWLHDLRADPGYQQLLPQKDAT